MYGVCQGCAIKTKVSCKKHMMGGLRKVVELVGEGLTSTGLLRLVLN